MPASDRHTFRLAAGVGVVLLALPVIWQLRLSSAEVGADQGEASSERTSTQVLDSSPHSLSVDSHLDKTPPRQAKGLDLVKLGWKYDCMECHKALGASWETDRLWVEHKDIELQHGNNKFCLNCHHPTNRNAFKNDDGSEIAEQSVVQLCARCHGTTHRDWEVGVHGRQNGFWDKGKGARTKLRCIECHDPHNPRFPTLETLPAPSYPKRAAQSSGKHEH